MPNPEIRYPCPVCLGVKLEKVPLAPGSSLVVDYCQRCGGIWFDEGEVAGLRRLKPKALWAKVTLAGTAYRMKCHNCQASMDRNAERCPACGWRNTIDCPACAKPLELVEQSGVRVDVCRRCRGAWFDNVELAGIWNRTVDALTLRRGAAAAPRDVTADGFFLPGLLWLPIPVPVPGSAPAPLPDVATAPDVGGGGLFDSVGNALGGAVEWTSDLAGDVFDGIGDVFDGIDF